MVKTYEKGTTKILFSFTLFYFVLILIITAYIFNEKEKSQ
jgi:hypothetical protein